MLIFAVSLTWICIQFATMENWISGNKLKFEPFFLVGDESERKFQIDAEVQRP